MTNNLIDFLSSYGNLSQDSLSTILENNIIRKFRKNKILLSEGQISKECYFVLKGCLRSYYILNDEEKTTEFFVEKDPVTPVSYTVGRPSKYYISCLENTIVAVGDKLRTNSLLKKHPEINSLFININEEQLASNRENLDSYINLSPEDRYKKLVDERPDLIQRVPQYHLASYLGIKPQSLSRIKSRMSKKAPLRK